MKAKRFLDMQIEHVKKALRAITPETLANHGFLKEAEKSGYVCPECGNGSGEDGTGIEFQQVGDTYLANCFKCGKGWDIIGVIADHYKTAVDKVHNFVEMLKEAADEFGISYKEREPKGENFRAEDFEEEISEEEKAEEIIEMSAEELSDALAGTNTDTEGETSLDSLIEEELEKINAGNLPEALTSKKSADIIENYGQAREELEKITPYELEARGFIKRDGYGEIICPCCHTETDGDDVGLQFFQLADGSFTALCVNCKDRYSNIDLIAARYGMDVETQEHEIIEKALDDFEFPAADESEEHATSLHIGKNLDGLTERQRLTLATEAAKKILAKNPAENDSGIMSVAYTSVPKLDAKVSCPVCHYGDEDDEFGVVVVNFGDFFSAWCSHCGEFVDEELAAEGFFEHSAKFHFVSDLSAPTSDDLRKKGFFKNATLDNPNLSIEEKISIVKGTVTYCEESIKRLEAEHADYTQRASQAKDMEQKAFLAYQIAETLFKIYKLENKREKAKTRIGLLNNMKKGLLQDIDKHPPKPPTGSDPAPKKNSKKVSEKEVFENTASGQPVVEESENISEENISEKNISEIENVADSENEVFENPASEQPVVEESENISEENFADSEKEVFENTASEQPVVEKSENVSEEKSKHNAEKNGGDTEEKKMDEKTEEGKYAKLIRLSWRYLENFVNQNGGTYRALTFETLRKFRVGYLAKMGRQNLPRVIIPTFSDNHFLARLPFEMSQLPEEIRGQVRPKQHYGQKDIFNLEDLLKASEKDIFFAVEGEFDAMSIYQVGFNAIAFSSCQISKFQKTQLEKIENKPRIIVLFDDDDAGRQNAEKAVKALKRLGFDAAANFLRFGNLQKEDGELVAVKDCNDALNFDAETLRARLEEITKEEGDKFQEQDEKRQRMYEIKNMYRTSQEIFPDCPVNVVIPDGYYVREHGIFKIFKTHDPEFVCGNPVFVSRIFSSSDYTEMKVQVTIWHDRKRIWHNHILKIEEISDARTLLKKISNMRVWLDMKGATRLSKYLVEMLSLEENKERIPETSFFQKTGWLQDDFAEFVYPTDLTGNYPVMKNNFDYATAFKKHGDAKKSLEIMRLLLTSSPTSRITLGAVLAAPLVRPFGLRNPQLHLCAKSGSGKSAVIKAAMSVWGNPSQLRQTFANTQRFIEELPGKFNDLPTWIDEFQSMNKFQRQNIDDQIYNFENGITRGRLNKDAEEKPQTIFSGVRITSGEQPITNFTSGQGAKNRVIELDFGDILTPKDAIKIHKIFNSQKTATFGHFGRQMVIWLANPENVKQLENFFDKITYSIKKSAAHQNGYTGADDEETILSLSDEVVGLIPAHVQMLSLFMTAAFGFAKMAFAADKKMVDYVDYVLREDAKNFVRNFQRSKLTTMAERALPAILETRETSRDRFQHLSTDGHLVASAKSPSLGIILTDGRVAFYPNQFRMLVKELGFESPDAIISGLSDAEVLDEGNSTIHKYEKCIGFTGLDEVQANRWLLVFKKDALKIMEERGRKYSSAVAAI